MYNIVVGELDTTSITTRRARGRAAWALLSFGAGAVLVGGGMLDPFVGRSPLAVALLMFSVAGIVLLIGAIARGRLRGASALLCVLILGAGWTTLRTTPRSDRVDQIVGSLPGTLSRAAIEVRGVLLEPPRTQQRVRGLADPPMWPSEFTSTSIEVHAIYVVDLGGRGSWEPCTGTLRLLLPERFGLRAGDQVELLGLYSPPHRAGNPGQPDWARLNAQRGSGGTIVVQSNAHISTRPAQGLSERARGGFLRWRWSLRERALGSIGLDGDDESSSSSMLAALLLGQRDPSFGPIYEGFVRVGAAHVLAISGFHLALVLMIVLMCLRLIGEHPRLRCALVLLVLGLTMLLIPMRPPLVRATAIVAALVLADGLGRRYERLTILCWVGLGLLVWRPMDALGLGYQLSMGVTALLVVLSDRQQRAMLEQRRDGLVLRDQPRTRLRLVLGWLGGLIRVNFACWLVAMPTILYHAGLLSVLAPLATLVLVPMVVVLMVVGYGQILIGMLSPALAQDTLVVLDALSRLVLGLVSWLDGLGWSSFRAHRISAVWAIAATIVMVLLVCRRWRVLSARSIIAVLLLIGWFVAEPMIRVGSAPLRVSMLDVGDGSCLLVQSGRRGIVWDCGSLDRRVGTMAGRSARALGITDLRDAIVTHDNLDHFNGLVDLAEHSSLRRVWISPRLRDDPSPAWRRIESALRERGLEIRTIERGDLIRIGGCELQVLWPDPELIGGLDDNDTSVVALVRTQSGDSNAPAVLLSGDIEGVAMDRIRIIEPGLGAALNSGVIELPHHGSAREKAYGFVDWLNPSLVLQSSGPSRLDDPRWAEQRGARVWRCTAERGAAWATIDKDGQISSGWYRAH